MFLSCGLDLAAGDLIMKATARGVSVHQMINIFPGKTRKVYQILERKQQVVVFNAFNEPLYHLICWLDEAVGRRCKLAVKRAANGRWTDKGLSHMRFS
jgi:hypothetical protein